MCSIEVRLPVDTAALVYETAVQSGATISATLTSLINDSLKTEVVVSPDND